VAVRIHFVVVFPASTEAVIKSVFAGVAGIAGIEDTSDF
jgi:hypothetical protein